MAQTVDSKKTLLKVPQIMAIAAQDTGTNRPVDQIIHMLSIELSLPNIWKCREGNTLFVVHKTPEPGVGYFRALNADTAQNYLENSKKFTEAAYKVGFDILGTQFEDPTILNIFKIISRSPMREQMGYVAKRTNSGGYEVTLQLGPQRRGQK
jgi:hypothetical protein